jgi:CRISPR-associated endonuclease/helicase Cas3
VVILDEAQLIPPEWRAPCVDVLRRLKSDYGVTVLLCSATQPPFHELKPVEIMKDPPALFRRLRRTKLIWPEAMDRRTDWPEVAQWMSDHPQALCVVNRKKDALTLYKLLLPKGVQFHLSTWMCAAHRKKMLETIKHRLAAGLAVRVVSTQLVEAGVDIDFPFVYRALAGLDSLAQAAGRCNREGKRDGLAPVRIFIPPDEPPVGLLRKGKDATVSLRASDPELEWDTPEIFTRYFELFQPFVDRDGKEFLEEQDENAKSLDFPFRSLGKKFRLIADSGLPILVRYEEGQRFAEEIRGKKLDRETMRKIQRYLVSVPWRNAESLRTNGLIEELANGLFVQTNLLKYDSMTGLAVEQDRVDPEGLMV